MDYEKAYKEALERARGFVKRWDCIEATDSELALKEVKSIFPELVESEDERIRKALISTLQEKIGLGVISNGYNREDYLAWLEKQKEQKSAEWSVEDKKKVREIYDLLVNVCDAEIKFPKLLSWFKSLRPNHWKPTKEQMSALYNRAIAVRYVEPELLSLYDDLKKL